jgi:ribosome-associated translation inhibitor RaiA
MKIEVRCVGIDTSDALRDHAVRRVLAQLSRFGRAVTTVVVRIGDINGPRKGADKLSRVTLRGSALGAVTVTELSPDAYAAVDLSVGRAARAAGRELERRRGARRGRSPRQRPARRTKRDLPATERTQPPPLEGASP